MLVSLSSWPAVLLRCQNRIEEMNSITMGCCWGWVSERIPHWNWQALTCRPLYDENNWPPNCSQRHVLPTEPAPRPAFILSTSPVSALRDLTSAWDTDDKKAVLSSASGFPFFWYHTPPAPSLCVCSSVYLWWGSPYSPAKHPKQWITKSNSDQYKIHFCCRIITGDNIMVLSLFILHFPCMTFHSHY